MEIIATKKNRRLVAPPIWAGITSIAACSTNPLPARKLIAKPSLTSCNRTGLIATLIPALTKVEFIIAQVLAKFGLFFLQKLLELPLTPQYNTKMLIIALSFIAFMLYFFWQ